MKTVLVTAEGTTRTDMTKSVIDMIVIVTVIMIETTNGSTSTRSIDVGAVVVLALMTGAIIDAMTARNEEMRDIGITESAIRTAGAMTNMPVRLKVTT